MNSQFLVKEDSKFPQDPNIFISEDISLTAALQFAFENGVCKVCIFFEAKENNLPRNKPKQLKTELQDKVASYDKISNVRFTRTNKLLMETSNLQCAQELVALTSILDTPVSPYIQNDSITTRFAIHNIDSSVQLIELGTEIQAENALKIRELKRFTKKTPSGVQLTETVLVTVYGTILPSEIRMFFMNERIRPFYDRPRQCQNCWRYDHTTVKCKYETVCKKCGGNHPNNACKADSICCINCNASHEATDLTCAARGKEMAILKFKVDNHLPITEARRQFSKGFPAKSYAAITKPEPNTIDQYVTKKDFETTMESFFKRMQDSVQAIIQEQMSQLFQAFEGFLTSLTARVVSGGPQTGTSLSGNAPHSASTSNKPKKTKRSKVDFPYPAAMQSPETAHFCSNLLSQQTVLSECMEGDT